MALARPLMRWNALACSLVWLSESGRLAGAFLCPLDGLHFVFEISFQQRVSKKKNGRPLDPCGHHRAACAEAGMLGRRGYALESIMARICMEAGGRVRTNLMIRDMDVPAPNVLDGRRLEVVVDGLFACAWWGPGGH